MRFLLTSHILPPATDGGSKIISKIGEYLEYKGHQTMYFSTDCHTTDDFVRPYKPIKLPNRLPIYQLNHRFPKPIFKISPFFKLIISSLRFHPDYIIAGPFPTTVPIYAYFLSLITGSKLILIPCYHENDPDFHQPILKFVANKAKLVCTLSDYESKYFSNPFVMRAGIDKNFLSQPKTPKYPNILFLGNLSSHKRIELLVAAFFKLISKYPNLTLTIAGQKTLHYPKIKKILNHPNINLYLTRYDDQTAKNLIDKSLMLVLPSVHESFGLVFIESMARGKPVIGADISPVSELLHLTGGTSHFIKIILYL